MGTSVYASSRSKFDSEFDIFSRIQLYYVNNALALCAIFIARQHARYCFSRSVPPSVTL